MKRTKLCIAALFGIGVGCFLNGFTASFIISPADAAGLGLIAFALLALII